MSPDQLWPLIQVILVDLMLAADNAIVIGLAAASVPANLRPRVIMFGIAAAAVLRILFALVTVQLLQIVGLLLVGGLLLLWVCWKLWRELRNSRNRTEEDDRESSVQTKSLRQAVVQIIVADVSMSLDNVLAVAGIARHEPVISSLWAETVLLATRSVVRQITLRMCAETFMEIVPFIAV